VFLIFRRPDTTARVFAEIARAKPPKLLVVADGPRPGHPEEAEKCAAARAVIEQVDWPCEVLTNYAETNMGLRNRVSSGLDWAFEQVEEAIILEDDCLPHPTFFRFCEELLERYREDERVMHIAGNDFQWKHPVTKTSYYYSRRCHCWGWATWRRAWDFYDHNMEKWPEVCDSSLLDYVLSDGGIARERKRVLQSTYERKIDSWDYIWTLSCWMQNGLSVLPNVNLITNIGFGPDGTHTISGSSPLVGPRNPMMFPLTHPSTMICDIDRDLFYFRNIIRKSVLKRILGKLKNILTEYSLWGD
jgi:hypothetical protein